MKPQLIGWLGAAILVLTICVQLYRQWSSGTSEGVSRWLFVGQAAASASLGVYSVLVDDIVFVVANIMLTLCALAGLGIVIHHRRKERANEPSR